MWVLALYQLGDTTLQHKESVPQRLKPHFNKYACGTAKAVALKQGQLFTFRNKKARPKPRSFEFEASVEFEANVV
jgi:hypothetical protein